MPSNTNPIATTIKKGDKADQVDFVENIFILDNIVFNKKNIFKKLFIRLNIEKGINVILYKNK